MRCAERHWLWLWLPLALGACAAPSGGPGSKPAASTPPAARATAPAAPAAPAADAERRHREALALLRGNQIFEAEEALLALTRDHPGYSGPWTNLGLLYARSNRVDEALKALQRAVSLNPGNAVAHTQLGVLYRDRKQYAKARAAYETALRLNPDDPLAHLNLGILFDAYLQQPALALPHYRAYQRLGGGDDLRVAVWIASIESALKSEAPAP
jgi:tetratricopeptide (TPR) repeat protein